MDVLPREARAAIYALLADLLTRELDRERLTSLDLVAAPFTTAEPALGPWLQGAGSEALEDLRAEFARLFLLPGGVSPRANAWLQSEDPAKLETLLDLVDRTMHAIDLEQTQSTGRLPSDHLGLLYAIVATAFASSDTHHWEFGEALEIQLGDEWVTRFATALHHESQAPLYRAIGRVISMLHQ